MVAVALASTPPFEFFIGQRTSERTIYVSSQEAKLAPSGGGVLELPVFNGLTEEQADQAKALDADQAKALSLCCFPGVKVIWGVLI